MSRPTIGKRFRQATKHEREVLRRVLIELRRSDPGVAPSVTIATPWRRVTIYTGEVESTGRATT